MASSPDHHPVPRIAPAANLHRGDPKTKESSPATSATLPVEPRKGAALSVSRQWVLPPRPKPGRKPKNLGPPAPKKKVGRPLSSLRSTANQRPIKARGTGSSSPQTSPKSALDEAGSSSSVASSTVVSPSVTSETSPPAAGAASKPHDDETCNLCTRDDCMCETIGLKTSSPPHKSLPSLGTILNAASMVKMDAVPLHRNPNNNGIKKFRKVESLRPLHPPLSAPSSMDGTSLAQQENCGFCTENSACACAEVSQVQQQQQTHNLPQQHHSQPSPMQPMMGFNSSSQFLTHVTPISPHMGPPPPPSHAHSLPAPSPYHYMMTPPSQHPQSPLPPPQPVPVSSVGPTSSTGPIGPEEVYSCSACEKDAMSMLFCLSIASAPPLNPGAVSLPCNLAFKTLQKHHRFEGCDLGKLVTRLEVNNKQVGVQSINRVLQELDRGEFMTL